MISLGIPAMVALLITLLATPFCRMASKRFGWLDQPTTRKLHGSPISRAGGIAIFVAYAAAVGIHHGWTILPAVFVAFGTGLLDDMVSLKPRTKLAGQAVAALLFCAAGISIHGAAAWWQVPLTVVWLMGCANAVNLIDGLDGLAAGIGLFATGAAFLNALLTGNVALAVVTAPLIGALLGFLPYNFDPASIFMGDSGSNTIGFLLGCYTVMWWQGNPTSTGIAAPVIVLALPIVDTGLAIFRRFVRREGIFTADRGHIHHRLLARGFSARRVALVLYGAAGLCACLAILLTTGRYSGGPVLAVFGIVAWLALRYLRYDEFNAVGAVCRGGFLRSAITADLAVRQFESAIRSADSIDECWGAFRNNGRRLGLSRASMQVYGQTFSAQFQDSGSFEACCSLQCCLWEGAGAIDMEIPSGPAPASIAPLANSLRTVFVPRLEALRPQLAFAATAAGRR